MYPNTRMTLFFAALFVTCVLMFCHCAPMEQPPEKKVISYSGYQVWAVTPRSNKENEFLMETIENMGI